MNQEKIMSHAINSAATIQQDGFALAPAAPHAVQELKAPAAPENAEAMASIFKNSLVHPVQNDRTKDIKAGATALKERIKALRAEPDFAKRSLMDQEEAEKISDWVTVLLINLNADPGKVLDDAKTSGIQLEDYFKVCELRLDTLTTSTSSTRAYRLATPKGAGLCGEGSGSLIGDRIARQRQVLKLLATDEKLARAVKDPHTWESNLNAISARLDQEFVVLTKEQARTYSKELDELWSANLKDKYTTIGGGRIGEPVKEYLARKIVNPANLNLVRAENKPAFESTDIIEGFVQGAKGNCATVAAIKLAMYRFGSAEKIFHSVRRDADNGCDIIMRDGTHLTLTAEEIQLAEESASFLQEKANDDVRSTAVLLYAASAKRICLDGNDGIPAGEMSFEKALGTMEDDEDGPEVIARLGLTSYVEPVSDFDQLRKRDAGIAIYAPPAGVGHAVFFTQDKLDHYGNPQDMSKEISMSLQNDPGNQARLDMEFAESYILNPYRS
jgi:hypothetical protein